MVLPAPAPDDPQGAPRAPWVDRVVGVVAASRQGVLVLARAANDGLLGTLARALLRAHPGLVVTADPAVVERCAEGAVVVYAPDTAHAPWLNLARPLFAQRALRVVLWARPPTIRALARGAPDFFDWISHRVEVPWAVAPFAVHGLRASLALGVGVDWRGAHLEAAVRALEPAAPIVRVDPTVEWERLVARVGEAPPGAWLVFDVEGEPRRAKRIRWLTAEAGLDARCVARRGAGLVSGWGRVHARQRGLASAERALHEAGVGRGGLLATLVELEPESLALCAASGKGAADEVEALAHADDPGALQAQVRAPLEYWEDGGPLFFRGIDPRTRYLATLPAARDPWRTEMRRGHHRDPVEHLLRSLRYGPLDRLRPSLHRGDPVSPEELSAEPDFLASVTRKGAVHERVSTAFLQGLSLLRRDAYTEALAALRGADDAFMAEPVLPRALLAQIRRVEGEVLTALGRYADAEVALFHDPVTASDPDAVDLAVARSSLWLELGLPHDAARWLPAISLGDAEWYYKVALCAASLALLRGDLDTAGAWYERDFLSVREPRWELIAARGRALVRAGRGDTHEALKLLDAVVRDIELDVGAASHLAAMTRRSRGEVLCAAGRYDESAVELAAARDLYASLFHGRHHGVGLARLALGRLHLRTARYGEARVELELARSILEEAVRPARPDAVRARVELARLDRVERLADAEATRAHFLAEAALLAGCLGDGHPEVVALRAEGGA